MAEAPTSLSYAGDDTTLSADGSTVTLGSGQSVTLAGFDLASAQAECQLGRGSSVPAGSTDYGFVDTTYTLTGPQLAGLTGIPS